MIIVGGIFSPSPEISAVSRDVEASAGAAVCSEQFNIGTGQIVSTTKYKSAQRPSLNKRPD